MLRTSGFLLLAAIAISAAKSKADYVLYWPDTSLPVAFVLEGDVDTSNNSRTLTLRTTKYGELILSRDSAEWYKIPSPRKKIKAQITAATKKKDAAELHKLGLESLKYGTAYTLMNVVEAIEEFEPGYKPTAELRTLAKALEREIPETPQEEKDIRAIIDLPGSHIARSEHFIMLHDFPEKPEKGKKTTRPQERLKLMERVYTGFLAFFRSRGVEVIVPRERLRTIFFREYQTYAEHGAKHMGRNMSSILGFYDQNTHCSYFYNFSENPDSIKLRKMCQLLQAEADEMKRLQVPGRADVIRHAATMKTFFQIHEDGEELETITHEVTHHLTFATGLMTRGTPPPRWAAEGLATYFESTKNATWSGIGAYNDGQYKQFRHLAKEHPERCQIDAITCDKIFFDIPKEETGLSYGPSWALTHFLMERHFKDMMKYYRILAAIPKSQYMMEPKQYARMFDTVFPREKRKELQAEFITYMMGMKPEWKVARDAKESHK